MKTYARTLGVVVILSLVFLGSPAFCDEQAMGKAEMMYASVIDKEIGKDHRCAPQEYSQKTEFAEHKDKPKNPPAILP